MKKIIIIIVSVAVVGLIWFLAQTPETAQGSLDEFAMCLKEKQVTMYGADWCPHCQNEKKAFGSSFKYVPYVECPQNPKLCLEKRVEGYPTWIFPDGKRLVGEQGINKLSEESGCLIHPNSGEPSPSPENK